MCAVRTQKVPPRAPVLANPQRHMRIPPRVAPANDNMRTTRHEDSLLGLAWKLVLVAGTAGFGLASACLVYVAQNFR